MELKTLQQIFVDTLGVDADVVTLEASLTDDLGADSLDAVEISQAIEEETGVAIPDEELGNIKTVKDIFDYVNDHAA